jgi:hypothetical protein
MAKYFPRHTIEFHLEEPAALRRFTLSTWEMALVTGAALRLYRLVAIVHFSSTVIGVSLGLTVGIVVLLGMATAHVANFPLGQWLRRLALFATFEILAEMAMSVALIALGREPIGSVRAHYADLLPLLIRTAVSRGLILAAWGAILATAVQLVQSRVTPEESEAR